MSIAGEHKKADDLTAADGRGGETLRPEISATAGGTTVRLAIAGELDRTTGEGLRRVVTGILRDRAPAILEIDARGLSLLDSSGVRCLLVCRKIAEAAGCRLVVVDPAVSVYQVLEITGLLDLFGVPSRPGSSVAAVRREPAVGRPVTPGPRSTGEIRDEAARLRRTALEIRQRAAAVRNDDVPRSKQV